MYHNLGGIEHARGNYPAAEAFALEGLAIRRGQRPPDPLALAADRVALGAILDGQGRDRGAARLYHQALPVFERAGDALEIGVTLNNLGALLVRRGRLARAVPLLERAALLKRQALGPCHPDLAVTLHNLACACRRRGEHARAASLFREAVTIFETAPGPKDPRGRACRACAERADR